MRAWRWVWLAVGLSLLSVPASAQNCVVINGVSQCAGAIVLVQPQATFTLPYTTSATNGVIKMGAQTLIHTYHNPTTLGLNLFMGPSTGSFTVTQSDGICFSGTACGSYLTGFGNGSATWGYVLSQVTSGLADSCFGAATCAHMTIANEGSAFGDLALNACVGCLAETALGAGTLRVDIDGVSNVGVGDGALSGLTHGTQNVGIGVVAGYTGTPTNACVSSACTNNTWVGYNTGPNTTTQLTDTIAIGSGAQNSVSHQAVIGTTTTTTNQLYGTPFLAALQSTTASPTGVVGTGSAMMGLNQTLTIVTTGRMEFTISGNLSNTVGVTDFPVVVAEYGTGTPPSNGASTAGTTCGSQEAASKLNAGGSAPFAVGCIVTGLTPGTAYWIDAFLTTVGGGTSTITSVAVRAHEF